MDINTELKDLIQNNIGFTVRSKKGWDQRNCMMCHHKGESMDTRRRFGIIYNPDGAIGVRCFNCRFKATYTPGHSLSKNFQLFMREIGISDYDIKRINFEIFRMGHSSNIVLLDKQIKRITDGWVESSLPSGAKTLSKWISEECSDDNFLNVLSYAYRRGMFELDELYWTPTEDFHCTHQRLIMPFRYNNKIVGYTGRLFYTHHNKVISKYINHFPTDYIYNVDVARSYDNQVIVLVEGVIDAYLIGAISTCGNTISDEQISYINGLAKRVVVCPDFDHDGRALVDVAIRNGWSVSFPNWDKNVKDPADACDRYGPILALKSIMDSCETNPIKIELKWKIRVKD